MAKAPSKVSDQMSLIREAAENSTEAFIKLVHPQRVLGAVHRELLSWWDREDAKSHQLVLLPRDHGKSAMVAYRVARYITRNPTLRVLYISSTAKLAQKQLKFIKDILESPVYRRYWPEHVNEEITKREKWTEWEIALDHPRRKEEAIRDPTIWTAGLETSITGMHCDIAVLDDVVVKENAYSKDGREKVSEQYSLLSSIEGSDAVEWAVGTRYHPNDLFSVLLEMGVDKYDENGYVVGSDPLYEKFERQVEDQGDGTGEFLWPRQQRYDGKWFGFDREVLARKRAQYIDKTQYRAQYYNDPNDAATAAISRDYFQYYSKDYLKRVDGNWFFKGRRLNVFAAVDFAFSREKKADSTSIVVVGVDFDYNYYVLDIDRFKTDKISEYFSHIVDTHRRWGYRKIRAEIVSAQKVIVQDLKDNYIRRYGLALSIDEANPRKNKEERIDAALQPRYANGQIWHYQGGNCQILEDELVLSNPPHDDVKDCLASVVEICVAPSPGIITPTNAPGEFSKLMAHPRFGGIS